jgi:hypothetical protein
VAYSPITDGNKFCSLFLVRQICRPFRVLIFKHDDFPRNPLGSDHGWRGRGQLRLRSRGQAADGQGRTAGGRNGAAEASIQPQSVMRWRRADTTAVPSGARMAPMIPRLAGLFCSPPHRVNPADTPRTSYIAPVRSPGQCVGIMPTKPRRRAPPTWAANDNKPGAKPAQRYVWSIYRAAARARWVGQV